MMLLDWVEERSEDKITKRFNIGPGDIRVRVEVAIWLLGAMKEITKLFSKKDNPLLIQLRTRVMYGINKELIDLVSLKGVGRVKARLLYGKDYKTLDDIKKAQPRDLAKIRGIGYVLASRVQEQLGVDLGEVEEAPHDEEATTDNKQSSLERFME